jgi:hypothetical protein
MLTRAVLRQRPKLACFDLVREHQYANIKGR